MHFNIPPYSPLNLGVKKDGRKVGYISYSCQRLSDGLFLDATNSTWVSTPTLNATKERGRGVKNESDPVTGILRGSYVAADPIEFANDADIVGQFTVLYHNKSKDNVVIGTSFFQNEPKLNAPLTPIAGPHLNIVTSPTLNVVSKSIQQEMMRTQANMETPRIGIPVLPPRHPSSG